MRVSSYGSVPQFDVNLLTVKSITRKKHYLTLFLYAMFACKAGSRKLIKISLLADMSEPSFHSHMLLHYGI